MEPHNHDSVQEQLDRVEAKLDYLVARIQEVDELIVRVGPMLAANPMLRSMLK